MKKLLFTIILFSIFGLTASKNCMSWDKTDFKTGVRKDNHKLVRSDCTCPCSYERTEKGMCTQCKHVQGKSTLKEETHHNNKHFAVDFVTTFSGSTR